MNYCETKESWQTKGALQCYHEGVSLSSRTTAGEQGRPKVRPPFIVRRPPIILRLTHDFTLIPRYASLLTVTSLRANHVFLPVQKSVRAVRGSSEAHFRPIKSVCKLGHLRSGTALTDEGLLLGNMAFGSVLSQPTGIANFGPSI
jgi:hypothetical protein